MVSFKGYYLGKKQCEVEHIESGSRLITSAPKDNSGDGSSFSPTDLCSISLVTCMMTVIGIIADRNGLSLKNSWYSFTKKMSDDPPRRIVEISGQIHLPSFILEDQRKILERAALGCPVYHSLHPEIKKEISFIFDVV
jgi:uncharacterized OsmC-like protein